MKNYTSCAMKRMIISFAFVIFSGCSSNSITSNPTISTGIKKSSEAQRHISVIALNNTATLASIIPQLAQSKVVLVGEHHTTYGDHLNQLAIIKKLSPYWKKMAIGLEFIQYPYQQALDDYIAGKITQTEMLRKTQWYQRWKYDFRLYRPLFEYAKQQQIPLLALNTPREITKRLSEVGIKGLSRAEREQLPKKMDFSNAKYKKALKAIYHQHGGKSHSKKFARFYQAQVAWDETMADKTAQFMRKNPKTKVVILAGSGHMQNRYGIPSRLQRRIKSKPIVVLNGIHDNPSPAQADYLLFSPDINLPKAGKIGVFMKDTAKGVLISKVMKASASAKADLKKGDFITRLNGKKVKMIEDIKINMIDAKPKQKMLLSVRRPPHRQLISKTLILQ